MKIKLRFAPSPTGNLHVGNARTALVNYLFSKCNNGEMLLRIDDTDPERSKTEFEENIKKDLNWLGIFWENTDRQSLRIDKYNNALNKLFEIGRAYRCYETSEELSLKRKAQLISGKPPVYDRQAMSLTEDDHQKFKREGKLPHWRFKLIDQDVNWTDLIRGYCNYNMKSLSDPVIMREDGRPIYTLASVVDDIDHNITHIIRGEDHTTNSAAQIQLFQALGSKSPKMGHLSLIAGSEGEGLSKRLGSLTLGELRKDGIESNALASLLARLGTSDPIVAFKTMEEIIRSFDLSKFSRNTAKFDVNELNFINKKSIQLLDYDDAKEKLKSLGLDANKEFWDLVSGNLDNLKQSIIWWKVIYGKIEPIIDNPEIIKIAKENFPNDKLDNSTWGTWSKKISNLSGLKGKELFTTLRKAITSQEHGPELSKLLPVLGREKILSRLSGIKS